MLSIGFAGCRSQFRLSLYPYFGLEPGSIGDIFADISLNQCKDKKPEDFFLWQRKRNKSNSINNGLSDLRDLQNQLMATVAD